MTNLLKEYHIELLARLGDFAYWLENDWPTSPGEAESSADQLRELKKEIAAAFHAMEVQLSPVLSKPPGASNEV